MFYLLSYDIADDRVRTQVMKRLKDEGYHLQKSVFVLSCTSYAEAMTIYQNVLALLDLERDSLFLSPLCQACLDRKQFQGRSPDFDQSLWII